jgi:protein-disulfide isomerase
MTFRKLAPAAFLLFATVAPAQDHSQPKAEAKRPVAAGKSALNKASLEAYLRNLELWPAQVQVKIDDPKPFIRGLYEVEVHLSAGGASKDVAFYVSADGKTVLRGTAHNIDHSPFQADLDLLKLDNQPSFGPAGAPLTLAIFSDFECPMCREEAKEIREKAPVEFPKDLRVVFTDFPLESLHPWAKPAAIAARCVFRQNAATFWDYHDWVFEHQPEIKIDNLRAKVLEWAKGKHLDAAQLGQCMDAGATAPEVDAEIAKGKKLQVDSTPTSFLNGRRLVGNVPWPNLSQIIKLELELLKHPVK